MLFSSPPRTLPRARITTSGKPGGGWTGTDAFPVRALRSSAPPPPPSGVCLDPDTLQGEPHRDAPLLLLQLSQLLSGVLDLSRGLLVYRLGKLAPENRIQPPGGETG
jgi:hypothetical protein